jgi:hypothetical protein
MNRFLRLVFSFLLSSALVVGARGADFERRLIPIAAGATPGGFGTVWTTRTTVVAEVPETEIVGVVTARVPPLFGRSRPSRVALPFSLAEPPGTILYIRADHASKVHVTAALLQEGVAAAQPLGLPVVSEKELVSDTIFFLDIVNDARARRHLRVYSLDLEHPNPIVLVRIQASFEPFLNAWDVTSETAHRLRAVQRIMTDYQGTVALPVRPLSLELPLEPLLRSLPEGAELAVSVVPSEGLHIWAMVSETDNATQRVRLFLPD